MFKIIFLIICSGYFIGCGSSESKNPLNPGFAQVRFTNPDQKLKSFMNDPLQKLMNGSTLESYAAGTLGRTFIYAVGQGAETYMDMIRLESENDDSPNSFFTLPNGTYKFYASGSRPGGELYAAGGFRRCGVVGPVIVDGTNLTLNLRVTEAGCYENTDITNPAYKQLSGFFRQMNSVLYSCANTAAFPASTTNCGGFCADCTGSPGGIQSFNVKILGYSNIGSIGIVEKPSLNVSYCVAAGAPPGFYTPVSLDIPIGNTPQAGKPVFRVQIDTDMTNTNCTTAGVGSGRSVIFNDMLFSAHGNTKTIGNTAVKLLPDNTNAGDSNLYFDH